MKYLFFVFALVLFSTGMASAQQATRSPRPDTDPILAQAQRFETQVTRLREAFNTGDRQQLVALESAVLTGLREEIERSETSGRPQLARQRAIFSEFENFSFYQAKPVDAQAKFLLLEEFAQSMK